MTLVEWIQNIHLPVAFKFVLFVVENFGFQPIVVLIKSLVNQNNVGISDRTEILNLLDISLKYKYLHLNIQFTMER